MKTIEAEFDAVKKAKEHVRTVLREEWATASETTHEALGTNKGEVRVNGECVWDKFFARTPPSSSTITTADVQDGDA